MNRIRSRDVEGIIAEKGFEAGTRFLLREMWDKLSHYDQQFRDMSMLIDRVIDTLSELTAVAHKVKQEHTKLRVKFGLRDDEDPSTQEN